MHSHTTRGATAAARALNQAAKNDAQEEDCSNSSGSSDDGETSDSELSDGDEAIKPLKCGRAGNMQVGRMWKGTNAVHFTKSEIPRMHEMLCVHFLYVTHSHNVYVCQDLVQSCSGIDL